MPFVPFAPPAPLRLIGPVTAVVVDAQRRRVFASGARSVAMIDADTGKLIATIRIGATRAIAIEPLGGHVFAGTSDGHVAELDFDRHTVVRSAPAGGPVDALAYNAVLGRLFADGGGRQAVSVFDSRSLAPLETFPFPQRTPGSMTTDPIAGDLLIANSAPEVAIVAPIGGTQRARFPTPSLPGNSIVELDAVLGQIAVIGSNATLAVYDRAGTELARISVPAGINACDVDTNSHMLACTGAAGVSFIQLRPNADPAVAGTATITGPVFAAFDTKTNDVLTVRSNPDGTGTDFERFTQTNGRDTHPIP